MKTSVVVQAVCHVQLHAMFISQVVIGLAGEPKWGAEWKERCIGHPNIGPLRLDVICANPNSVCFPSKAWAERVHKLHDSHIVVKVGQQVCTHVVAHVLRGVPRHSELIEKDAAVVVAAPTCWARHRVVRVGQLTHIGVSAFTPEIVPAAGHVLVEKRGTSTISVGVGFPLIPQAKVLWRVYRAAVAPPPHTLVILVQAKPEVNSLNYGRALIRERPQLIALGLRLDGRKPTAKLFADGLGLKPRPWRFVHHKTPRRIVHRDNAFVAIQDAVAITVHVTCLEWIMWACIHAINGEVAISVIVLSLGVVVRARVFAIQDAITV